MIRMKKLIHAAQSMYQIQVTWYPQTFGQDYTPKTQTFKGTSLPSALLQMADVVSLRYTREDIDEMGWGVNEFLQHISQTNGNGADFIEEIKDLGSGRVLFQDSFEV